jgi:hypothetical protein
VSVCLSLCLSLSLSHLRALWRIEAAVLIPVVAK